MTINLWQEEQSILIDTHYKLQVGALQLYLSHLQNEWHFHHSYLTSDESESEKKIAFRSVKIIDRKNLQFKRFIQSNDSNQIKIRPKLADRSIVAKPHEPIFLPSKQTITIYISTPVWLAFFVNGNENSLFEIPTFELPDTWFGPKPSQGELCYASRFSGRVKLDSLPRRAGRIITPVTIENNGIDNLKLDKLAIPSDFLSIYLTQRGELWTPSLNVIRETDSNKTQVNVEKILHPQLENAELITKPRVNDTSGLLLKTINMFFA